MKLWVLVLILACSVFMGSQDAPTSKTHSVLEKNVPVPMRDGVVLRADVMRPPEADKFPVLVYRTPYGKDTAQLQYTTFKHAVERGYAVVIQDVRGRHHSDGDFRPYENEGLDGYDTIEWAAAQTWSNGDVGTFGLSYPGAVQWLAAVQNPPHLKAMVPAMTFSTPQNFFYAGGTWDMSWIEWIWDDIAWDTRAKKNPPGPRTYREALAALTCCLDRGGPITARIFVSCDCRDFDLWTRLLDVSPDGTAINLMSPGLDVLRASYRDFSRGRQLLSPGTIYELKLENLITSNVFLQGHRIRLQISASFTPNFSRNLQSGKSEVNSVEMKRAHIRVFHDAKHLSQVVLPIIPVVR